MGGGLYPDEPGASERVLLCDGCFQAATGQLALCEDGCPLDLDHQGLCLRDSPDECRLCGAQDRLHDELLASIARCLPTAGKDAEGLWYLRHAGGAQGPFPSARAAWDYWHANGHGEAPVPPSGGPEEAP